MDLTRYKLASKNEVGYNGARSSILTILLFSVINIFSIAFGDSYFLFSSYITQVLVLEGLYASTEMGDSMFLVIFLVMAVISVIPYLLCFLFSKKKTGWMIVAAVLFSIDTAIFFFDFLVYLLAGYYSGILDALFHVWALVSIIKGVGFAKKMKKEKQEKALESTPCDEYIPEFQRTITVTYSQKSRTPIVCFVNGKAVCILKRGESHSFVIDERVAELTGALASGQPMGTVQIPAGTGNISYEMALKSGFSTSPLKFTEVKM